MVAKQNLDTGKVRLPRGWSLAGKANVCRWADRMFLISCFAAILFVSAVDTWFAAMNKNILSQEMNPLCTWLLSVNSGCFVAVKTCGTLAVFATLFSLLRLNYQHARLVVGAVTLFQLGLLTFLCLSDPLMDDGINFNVLLEESEPSVFAQFYQLGFTPI